MPNQRVYIATWADSADYFTAATLQADQADATIAYAETAASAVRQIKEHLRWLARRDQWYTETEMEDVEVRRLRLAIRPRHQHAEHDLLLPGAVQLRIPCVIGRLGQHSWLGTMPTLGLSFIVESVRGIQRIAEEQVRAHLNDSTTRDLLPYLAVSELELQEVSIPKPAVEIKVQHDVATSGLEAIAAPLGKPIRREKLDPVFQRDGDIRTLTKQLVEAGSSILLLGEEGVGKSAILAQAARAAVRLGRESEGPAPPYRIWASSPGRLIAGMKYLGQWQQRCEEVIDELGALDGWLCIDSLHELVLTGGKDPRSSLAAFFLPYIRHGQLRMVCEASPTQLVAAQRLLPEFVELFTKWPIARLGKEDLTLAIEQGSQVVAEQHQIEFVDNVPATTLQLVQRFEPYKAPLAPALQCLRQLASSALRVRKEVVSTDDVFEGYAERTGLPLEILLDSIPLELNDVLANLQAEVVGQARACRDVANVITTFKSGLSAPHRPLGVLLFCGPTGVGKTQLAKTVGRYLFGHSRTDSVVRLDMSEYGGPSAADRLMCKPDRSPSAWIQRVQKQPFCVLLLDEIEKANAQIFDVIMGLLDEGRLRDVYGRVTDFTSCIVIMTTNLGTSSRQDIGFNASQATRFESRVREFFRPEFFNRIDAITPFENLSPADCRQIIALELAALQKRDGLSRRNIELRFDDDVVDLLLQTGFDQALGARPLQRTLEELVTAPVARYLAKYHQLRDMPLFVRHRKNSGIEVTRNP